MLMFVVVVMDEKTCNEGTLDTYIHTHSPSSSGLMGEKCNREARFAQEDSLLSTDRFDPESVDMALLVRCEKRTTYQYPPPFTPDLDDSAG